MATGWHRVAEWVLRLLATSAVAAIVLILVFIAKEAAPLFYRAAVRSEVTLTKMWLPQAWPGYDEAASIWQPVSEIPKFGIWPLITGTLKVTIVAMAVSVPLGVFAARAYEPQYKQELRRLRELLLLMGAKVEESIRGSIRTLMERDTALAEQMIAFDRKINQLEVEIDELCMQILARRQPVASDLRFIAMALKLVTDLERIGDLGVNMCERVVELNAEPPLKPYVDLPNMAREVQGMLHGALDAFVAGDADRAQRVIVRDRNIDAYYTQIFRELLTYMMEDPRNIFRATRLQSIAKYLERIGDHVTNLGEMVVFMVKGQDIRHVGKLGDGSNDGHA
jgi:phosphate transport system protein